ncbi:MAG: hypothetical protein WCI72_05715, partial [archaeon]
MIVEINESDLEISESYQCLCLVKSNSFRQGCPNYGKKPECPPRKLFSEDYDLTNSLYLIATDFDLTEHAQRIRKAHLDWTEKAVYNPRYWQATARKLHEAEIEDFLKEHRAYSIERSPEGCGINVTNLCRQNRIYLEWPPRKLARIISIGAIK